MFGEREGDERVVWGDDAGEWIKVYLKGRG
jgi:hypothetical protein